MIHALVTAALALPSGLFEHTKRELAGHDSVDCNQFSSGVTTHDIGHVVCARHTPNHEGFYYPAGEKVECRKAHIADGVDSTNVAEALHWGLAFNKPVCPSDMHAVIAEHVDEPIPACSCEGYMQAHMRTIEYLEHAFATHQVMCMREMHVSGTSRRMCDETHKDYPQIGVKDGGGLTFHGCRSDMTVCASIVVTPTTTLPPPTTTTTPFPTTTTTTTTTEEPPPTTESTTTDEPPSPTEATSTESTTTQASTTQASTTQASTTQASTTQASTTQASTTQASTTQASTTQASTTPAPKDTEIVDCASAVVALEVLMDGRRYRVQINGDDPDARGILPTLAVGDVMRVLNSEDDDHTVSQYLASVGEVPRAQAILIGASAALNTQSWLCTTDAAACAAAGHYDSSPNGSPTMVQGDSFCVKYNSPGVYGHSCREHPGLMFSTVHVTGN